MNIFYNQYHNLTARRGIWPYVKTSSSGLSVFVALGVSWEFAQMAPISQSNKLPDQIVIVSKSILSKNEVVGICRARRGLRLDSSRSRCRKPGPRNSHGGYARRVLFQVHHRSVLKTFLVYN